MNNYLPPSMYQYVNPEQPLWMPDFFRLKDSCIMAIVATVLFLAIPIWKIDEMIHGTYEHLLLSAIITLVLFCTHFWGRVMLFYGALCERRVFAWMIEHNYNLKQWQEEQEWFDEMPAKLQKQARYYLKYQSWLNQYLHRPVMPERTVVLKKAPPRRRRFGLETYPSREE